MHYSLAEESGIGTLGGRVEVPATGGLAHAIREVLVAVRLSGTPSAQGLEEIRCG